MRKFRLWVSMLVAIAAMAVGGGAMASTASAASCVAGANAVYYDGYFTFRGTLVACSGVSGAQFSGTGDGKNGGLQHIGGLFHNNIFPPVSILLTQISYGTNYSTPIWGPGCNGTVMPVQSHHWYRIRNSFGGSWGSWHEFVSGTQYIC